MKQLGASYYSREEEDIGRGCFNCGLKPGGSDPSRPVAAARRHRSDGVIFLPPAAGFSVAFADLLETNQGSAAAAFIKRAV